MSKRYEFGALDAHWAEQDDYEHWYEDPVPADEVVLLIGDPNGSAWAVQGTYDEIRLQAQALLDWVQQNEPPARTDDVTGEEQA